MLGGCFSEHLYSMDFKAVSAATDRTGSTVCIYHVFLKMNISKYVF